MPEWLRDIEGVFVCVPDYVGRLSGKRISSHRLADVMASGLGSPDFHLITDLELDTVPGMAASGPATGFRNGLLRPIAETLRQVPWDPATAIILADAYRD